ncbi:MULTISPECIES: NACHT domain-containing protein [Amycolatopsis]|uniref:NACHT domain-containing protein n=1 Tax=Amycolatopsis albidoflavus TaxID=102226 RepID=A0ABW5I8J0_9PSEU
MARQIHDGLQGLRRNNGFHEFEALCLDFANAALGGHFVPATGPVGDGGDGGQDFASYMRLTWEGKGIAVADKVVGICTIGGGDLVKKIRADLRAVAADARVVAVYAFLASDLQVTRIQRLEEEAKTHYDIKLEVFDGNRLAKAMARADFAALAYRRLNLDQRSLATAVRTTDEARTWARETIPDSYRPEFHDYLTAVKEASSQHPWSFVDQIPDLDKLYQPQLLEAADRSTCTWQEALERSEHVFVTGPAGAGKSSLMRHIGAVLSSRWLGKEPQPWMPVPIHTRDIAAGKPLIQAIGEGVEQRLGSLLHQPLDTGFFDHEPLSGRWLVLIDGLDEVRNYDQRQEAIRAAESAAGRSAMQFVIASRPGSANTTPAPFTSYEIRPFDSADEDRYIGRWLELRNRPSEVGTRARYALNTLLDWSGQDPSPLLLLMVCALADSDSGQSLPETSYQLYTKFTELLVSRLTSSGEPVINDLQNQIHTLAGDAASHRLLKNPGASLLDLAIKSAAAHGVTPPARLVADWHRTVEEVLIRSGLMTKHRDRLDFLHASFEEHYALRALPEPSPEDIVDMLTAKEPGYYNAAELVDANLQTLELLLERTSDMDSAVAAIVQAYPSAVAVVVKYFRDYGLGERTASALNAIANDRSETAEVQAQAAAALDGIEPGKGIQRRLALSINLDMEDDDRLNVIAGLVRYGGHVAAAIQWLTFQTLDSPMYSDWNFKVAPLLTCSVSDEDLARGLRLIASNTQLPVDHQVAACLDLANYDQKLAYRLLRSFTTTRWLTTILTDDQREGYTPTLLKLFIKDDTVTGTHRLDAIEYIEDKDPHRARDLYETLLQSCTLTDQQRQAVSSAIERTTHS